MINKPIHSKNEIMGFMKKEVLDKLRRYDKEELIPNIALKIVRPILNHISFEKLFKK